MSRTTTITINRRRAAVGIAAAMLISAPMSSALASGGDPRSPDARDAGISAQVASHPAPTRSDFRSPDARDAATRAVFTPRGDAGYVGLRTPVGTPVALAAPRVAPTPQSPTSGIAWGYVALMLALALVAGMGLNESLRRHRLGRLLTPRA